MYTIISISGDEMSNTWEFDYNFQTSSDINILQVNNVKIVEMRIHLVGNYL